jgi:hypothetical protein
MNVTRATLCRIALPVIGGAILLLPAAAQAYWRGGVFFGFPPVYVAPPPAYYYPPPPVYLAPPPVYAVPPAYTSGPPPLAQACFAGPLVCPLDRPTPSGDSCSCIANGARAWGRAN